MWISQQFRQPAEEPAAAFGTVTISGEDSAVLGTQESRGLPVIAPAGIFWRPEVGARVVTLGQGAPCIVGCQCSCPEELEPGELLLRVGTGSVRLRGDGTIHLTGTVYLNVQLLGGGANDE